MKIDGANQSANALRLVGGGRDDKSANESSKNRATKDRVDLSGQAKLLKTAMKAIQDSGDIREDVVAQMRQKLENGEIGQDPVKTAERMIQRLVDESTTV